MNANEDAALPEVILPGIARFKMDREGNPERVFSDITGM